MRSVNRFHERASGWLVVALCAFLPLMSGCINVDLLGAGGGPLVEETLDGDGGDKILLVEISGVIDDGRRQESIFGSDAAATVFDVRAVLDEARDDDDIRAVLLRIDSPGGRATASDLIHEEITRFKQERSVPVFAQLMGVAASGGYYVAVAADEIVAHPTTITGSIGVIFQGFNAAGLIDKIGVEDQTIVSGERKDAGSPLRRMSADERAMMQRLVDTLHARFVRVVDEGRPELDLASVSKLADGGVYSAEEALSVGLVDAVGSLHETVERLKARAGLGEARVVRYTRRESSSANLYSRFTPASPGARVGLPDALGRLMPRSGMYYLWYPGIR